MSPQTEGLRALRLNWLSENHDEFLAGCKKGKMSPEQVLDRLVELELVEKTRRGTERRVKSAKLGTFKHISEFDWAWPKKIDRDSLESALKGDFIEHCRNIILAGAQGLGKTMIAKNIGHNAAINGKSTIFTSTSDMILSLKKEKSKLNLDRAFKKYVAPDLLIMDELGYLSYDCQAADLIFEVINRRYETGSIVISTNLAFKDWNTIFPSASCLTAMIDRLTHHAEVLKIEGDSFRLRESMEK